MVCLFYTTNISVDFALNEIFHVKDGKGGINLSNSLITIILGNFQSNVNMGAQWLSGRVLDSRPRGRGFEPHRRHCVVVLEQDTLFLA